ncbi:MAG: HAD family hydrolase [Syntrophothermus sp.]
MKDLIVLDFDKTLIPFDSFRKYLLIWLKHFPFFISGLIISRKLRTLSLKEMKESLIIKIRNHKNFNRINVSFAKYLVAKINYNLLEEIKKKGGPDTVFLLISASPDEYISLLSEDLGFVAKGSYFDKGFYFHLYKKEKIEFLKNNFPRDEFHYLYAISDSETDREMLGMFQDYSLLVT